MEARGFMSRLNQFLLVIPTCMYTCMVSGECAYNVNGCHIITPDIVILTMLVSVCVCMFWTLRWASG